MVDTHAHLSACEAGEGELVAAASAAGVRRILDVGMDEETNAAAVAAAEAHDGVFASVGRHPNSAAGFDDRAAGVIEELVSHERVRAVGETGLDYYRDRAPRKDQMGAFRAQIGIARRAGLPIVIHMRESVDETFGTLASEADGVPVILHCFSAPPEWVPDAIERGWYCSFAGNSTYPKADALREAARLVPDDLLLVETDAPFLSPQPARGRPNQPANVVATAELLAEVRSTPYTELERVVEENAKRLFDW